MFPNLRAEMARGNIKATIMAEVLEISYDSVINKINGRTDFTRTEIFKIRDKFFPSLTLEYLFKTEHEGVVDSAKNNLKRVENTLEKIKRMEEK